MESPRVKNSTVLSILDVVFSPDIDIEWIQVRIKMAAPC
jgi:hypothetical protein